MKLSLCSNCNCMTKQIKGKCGKCKKPRKTIIESLKGYDNKENLKPILDCGVKSGKLNLQISQKTMIKPYSKIQFYMDMDLQLKGENSGFIHNQKWIEYPQETRKNLAILSIIKQDWAKRFKQKFN